MYLPPGTTIEATDITEWSFPVGTRFWKEFTFNDRRVETRFIWKVSASRWIFATYQWNAEGTEAMLADAAGVPGVVEVASGRRHDIPSVNDCTACHGTTRPGPLGFNALQLSPDRDPNAIHGEPLAPGMVTLKMLVDERLLTPTRTELVASPPRIQTTNPRTRSALGYLAANCATCHNGMGEIAARGPTLKMRDLLADGDAVARSLMGQRTKWQVPGQPEGASVLVDSDTPETSAILARMRSRRPSSQMPPLGTAVRDQEAIDAVFRWITADLHAVTVR